jgi:GNAT superfamily N-acetyltransferase
VTWFTRFAHLLKGNPDQPRDERGRWTLTGTGEPGSVLMSDEARAEIARMDVTAFARITGASPVELTEKFLRGTGLDLRIDGVGLSGRNEPFVYWTVMKDGREIAHMSRKWSPDGTLVFHDNLEIAPESQGGGLGRALLGNMFAHYRQSGVEEVRILAARELGGYVWARAGFAPDKVTAEYIQTALQTNLDRYVANRSLRNKAQPLIDGLARDPRNIWKIADLPDKVVRGRQEVSLGKAILMDTHWADRIRLDDPQAMARLDAYVNARPLRKAETAAAPLGSGWMDETDIMAALIAEVDAQREAEEAEKKRKQPVGRLTVRPLQYNL